MSNKPLITAISISKETDDLLYTLQKKYQKNRSQLIRDLINFYAKQQNKSVSSKTNAQTDSVDLTNPNVILRKYYELISSQTRKPSLVIGIAIINRRNKVLIGLRKTRDPLVKNLTWTFPSGRFINLNFETELVKNTFTETGFETKVMGLIHARVIPDIFKKGVQVIALYYHCRIISGKLTAGGDMKESKWVPAEDINKYFTTSISDEIMNFLARL